MVKQRFTAGLSISVGPPYRLLSEFFSNYSTNIKRFAWKLARLRMA
jgi:hypothetical protein